MTLPDWLPPRLHELWPATPLALLRSALVGEAEGESYLGKVAVGCVLRNRVRLPWWWGRTWHEVILFPQQLSCFWADWRRRRSACLLALGSPDAYEDAQAAARAVLGGHADVTDGATHYFNPRHAQPKWASHLVRTVCVGGHDFYREV